MIDLKEQTTRRKLLGLGLSAVATGLTAHAALAEPVSSQAQKEEAAGLEVDLCVYGGTPAGIMAAVRMRRRGKRVVLLEPGRHLGGMAAGGLSATDVGNPQAIGGLAREFYRRVYDYYTRTYGPNSKQVRDCRAGFAFEPKVAEAIYGEMANEAGVSVHLEQRLKEVRKASNRIVEITMESGRTFRAKVFIDATYEGDLLAKSGVSYIVGRESNAQYGETLNGVQLGNPKHNFRLPVDPYIRPGDSNSGVLPGISLSLPAKQGEGDRHVQAYNYRLCLTDVPTNQIPFPRPKDYEPDRYLILARYLQVGGREFFHLSEPLPNGKTDANNSGPFSTDFIGGSDAYPEADWATRERIAQEHVSYQQGFFYFLCHDDRVPWSIRKEVGRWGLAKDEFVDNGGWPHQLYIREARRMIGEIVMTETHCRGTEGVEDSIGLASYPMDSHNCQRLVVDGRVVNEGDVQVGGFKPYSISYRAITPREAQCANLLVPVCLSSSHIAYGSIRMEPVFMILGDSAGVAADLAIEGKLPVQRIDPAQLQDKLLDNGQILFWNSRYRPVVRRIPAIDPKSLPGVVVDDRDSNRVGPWMESTQPTVRRVGPGYIHDGNQNKGLLTVSYTPDLPDDGTYTIILLFPPDPNRATNVPVTLQVEGVGTQKTMVDQRNPERNGTVSLGNFKLPKGKRTTVTISNRDTDGYVVADAVQFVAVT